VREPPSSQPEVREPLAPQPKPAAAPASALPASEPEHAYMLLFLGFLCVLLVVIGLIAGASPYAIIPLGGALVALVLLLVRLARRGSATTGSG
jgi:hypothetical protein